MLESLLKYPFLQNAVISAILASIACGIIGTIIVEKKLVMMSGGIAHTAFGGIGLGYFLGINPLIGALVFCVGSSVGITAINRKTNTNADTIIGMFWALGMALGILFVGLTPGYPPDMNSYLFGDILNVSKFDVRLMFFMDIIIIFVVTMLFNTFKAYLFDEEFSFTMGIKTVTLEYGLFILIALTIVILLRLVGIILVMALLTTPPAIAKLFSHNLKRIMLIASLLGTVFCLVGLWVSYTLNIPSGASIIIITVSAYFIAYGINKLVLKSKLSKTV